MHRLTIAVALFAIHFAAPALSPTPSILEPVNWEADADPRFDPRVEQILIDLIQYKRPAPADPWTSWDLTALERLRVLMDDPRWKNFTQAAIRLFYQCPLDGAPAIQAAELQRRADAVTHDPENAFAIFQSHMNYAANNDPDLLRDFLGHPTAKIRVTVVSHLIRMAQSIPPDAASVIDHLADSEVPEECQSAAYLLCEIPSEENSKRALALAATVSDETVRNTEERLKYRRAAQERRAAIVRAKEPMGMILDKESKL